jgi:hypothetical protein
VRRLPHWNEQVDVIWYEDALAYLEVTEEQLGEMVQAQTRDQRGHDIIVTGRSDYELVMALYAAHVRAEGRPAQVCHTLEEALGVVGLVELPSALAHDTTPEAVLRWTITPGEGTLAMEE